jgi:spore coat polysaccharide biosynthesis predicted glycosyltransferase SpsG
MKIAFLTDGGLEMGMGHIQHSMTLAEELKDRGETCFLTTSDEIVVTQLKSAGFETHRLNSDNEVAKLLKEMRPNIVVIDKLNVDKPFAKKIKDSLNAKLVIFNNLTLANKSADIAVTADIGSRFKNIRRYDKETGTLYFYGPKYWFLRREFYEFHQKGKIPGLRIKKILLIFGGSDPSDLTSTVLDELLGLSNDFKIDVILGAHFAYFDRFNQVLAEHQEKRARVNVYRNIRNVAELMYKADLVMASPGLSVFEALCVGTPVIVMPQNLLQRDVYQEFMPTLAKDQVHKLGSMIAGEDFVDPRQEHIAQLEIGQGRSELIEEILKQVSDS